MTNKPFDIATTAIAEPDGKVWLIWASGTRLVLSEQADDLACGISLCFCYDLTVGTDRCAYHTITLPDALLWLVGYDDGGLLPFDPYLQK